MADAKISALTAASTPLAGTEVLPIVQSGTTKKVAVSSLTAGRAVSTGVLTVVNGTNPYIEMPDGTGTTYIQVASGDLNFVPRSGKNVSISNSNLVIGTAAKGIDFSANGGDVLSQYDEGTYTPVFTASSSNPTVTYSRQRGKYVRVGNVVTISVDLIWDAISGGSGDVQLSLPFAGESSVGASGAGPIAVLDGVTFAASRTFCNVQPQASVLYATLPQAGSGVSTSNTTVAQLSASGRLVLSCTYLV